MPEGKHIDERKNKMNAVRRKKISKIMDALAQIQEELQEVLEEEQEAFDNMPESIQFSERGGINAGRIGHP